MRGQESRADSFQLSEVPKPDGGEVIASGKGGKGLPDRPA